MIRKHIHTVNSEIIMFLLYSTVLLLFINGANANPALFTSHGASSLIQKDDVSTNCPTGYSQPANANWNTCYRVYTNYKNRQNAAAKCKQDNGTLAAVPNAFVNSYIYSLATQSGTTSLWLGTECFNGDVTTCTNDDDTNFVYNRFYPDQPTTGDICVYMSTIGRDSQKWKSFDCEQNFQFVCEVAAGSIGSVTVPTTTRIPTTTTHHYKTCATGWTEYHGVCYTQIDRPGTTRDQQNFYCQQTPGGQLASISSKEMNDFMSNLPCDNNYFRIGLQCPDTPSPGDTSTCVWDDGTPFNYSAFAKGEPSSAAPHNCAYSYLGSWYNSYPCSQLFECFACEAPMQ